MRRALPDILPWFIVVIASTAALYMLQTSHDLEEAFEWFSPVGHLQVVTLVSVVCALLAGGVSVVVLKSPNTRLLWLALAFLSMSGLYAVHGLATPGVILAKEYPAVIGFSARLAFVACSAFLAASAVEWKGRVPDAVGRHRGIVLLLTVAALVGYAVVALVWPEIVPAWFAGGAAGGYETATSTGDSYSAGDY